MGHKRHPPMLIPHHPNVMYCKLSLILNMAKSLLLFLLNTSVISIKADHKSNTEVYPETFAAEGKE